MHEAVGSPFGGEACTRVDGGEEIWRMSSRRLLEDADAGWAPNSQMCWEAQIRMQMNPLRPVLF